MIFRKKAAAERVSAAAERMPFRLAAEGCIGLESGLYEQLRAQVPIIDACFGKIIRLTNDFRLTAESPRAQRVLDEFSENVAVGVSGCSVSTFADLYLDSLLTYGRAFGGLSIDSASRRIKGILVADPTQTTVRRGRDPLEPEFRSAATGERLRLPPSEISFYTTLNPSVKHPDGVSILRGVPALAEILMKIYECVGQNFDRVGNVRYAVTYKPDTDADRAFAKERAKEIARAWTEGMNSAAVGQVKDFVAVGDVDIKVIGADNKMIDTEVPVRQLLEQIVAKLGIPPFILGLNWQSTERMSSQQADILTSELEYYRRLLTPVLKKLGRAALRIRGLEDECSIEWGNINLQDEEALARARLMNAQAAVIETEQRKENANGK
ncbi:MAG: serine/threonine protein phosphatase [Ruminococcus sp.]|nr:serine/threonine protein phosphatase [Ruminococcus sp.]